MPAFFGQFVLPFELDVLVAETIVVSRYSETESKVVIVLWCVAGYVTWFNGLRSAWSRLLITTLLYWRLVRSLTRILSNLTAMSVFFRRRGVKGFSLLLILARNGTVITL